MLTIRFDDLDCSKQHQIHNLLSVKVRNVGLEIVFSFKLVSPLFNDEVVPFEFDHLPLDNFFFDSVLAD